MSKVTVIEQALRGVISDIDVDGDKPFRPTTLTRPTGTAPENTVMIITRDQSRDPAGGGKQWHSAMVIVVVCSKLEAETEDTPATAKRNDRVQAVYDGVIAAAAGSGTLAPGGASGIADVKRSEIVYWAEPGNSAGRSAGGVFVVKFTWKQ